MPRRTNEFQNLVNLIERQLAPEGARVTQSKLLEDATTGEKREVDIAIETEVGGHPVVIGVECIDRSRPASVQWIDQLLGKYRDLPVHKIIAVSRSGFTKPALRKASDLNIEAVALREAATADWVAKISNLSTVDVVSFLVPYPTEVTVNLAASSLPSDSSRLNVREPVLYGPSGTVHGSLSEIVDRVLADPAVVKEIEERAFTDSNTIVELIYRFPQGTHIVGPAGSKHEVDSLLIKAKCRKEVSTVPLRHGEYGAAQVAVGTGASLGRPIGFAFVEERGKQPSVGLSVRGVKRPGSPRRRHPKEPPR